MSDEGLISPSATKMTALDAIKMAALASTAGSSLSQETLIWQPRYAWIPLYPYAWVASG